MTTDGKLLTVEITDTTMSLEVTILEEEPVLELTESAYEASEELSDLIDYDFPPGSIAEITSPMAAAGKMSR